MALYRFDWHDVYNIRRALSSHADYCDEVFDSNEFGDAYREISKRLVERTRQREKEEVCDSIGFVIGQGTYELKGDDIWRTERALRDHNKHDILRRMKVRE